MYPTERYRLILRHDIVSENETIEIDPPCVVEFTVPHALSFPGGPIDIEEMFDRMSERMKHGILQRKARRN